MVRCEDDNSDRQACAATPLSYKHRVDRVLGSFSSRPNWDPPPPPHPQVSVHPLWFREGGGGTLPCGRGGGVVWWTAVSSVGRQSVDIHTGREKVRQMTSWHTGRLSGWQAGRLSDWQASRLFVRLTGRQIVRLKGRHKYILSDIREDCEFFLY
jgi:hypothetical protein